jgi:hypothetical protein
MESIGLSDSFSVDLVMSKTESINEQSKTTELVLHGRRAGRRLPIHPLPLPDGDGVPEWEL